MHPLHASHQRRDTCGLPVPGDRIIPFIKCPGTHLYEHEGKLVRIQNMFVYIRLVTCKEPFQDLSTEPHLPVDRSLPGTFSRKPK